MTTTFQRAFLIGAVGLLGACSGGDPDGGPAPIDPGGPSIVDGADPLGTEPGGGSTDDAGDVPVDGSTNGERTESPTVTPDPGTDDPAMDDPTTGDASEPDASEPDESAPGTDDPATRDPVTSGPEAGEPDAGEPDGRAPDTGGSGTGDSGTSDPDTSDPGVGDPGTAVSDGGDPDTSDPGTSDPDTSVPGTDEPVTADPVERNLIRVDFDITVPVYMSSALQVRLTWGDKDIAAAWVGDEFWTISDTFPTDTENLLTVTFHDENGGITLGTFEDVFRTGTNAAEEYRIAASQFDTFRWDDDDDGKSNLNELIDGTDPRVDERDGPKVREWRRTPPEVDMIGRVSGYYEFLVPDALPYRSDIDETDPVRTGNDDYRTVTILRETVELDASGTGSVSRYDETDFVQEREIEIREATRTNADGIIVWAGTYRRIATGPGHDDVREFTTRTRAIDGRTRGQEGTIVRSASGFGGAEPQFDLSYSLTGELVDDSSRCEPVAGTIVHDAEFRVASEDVDVETRYTRERGDLYWNVSLRTLDGRLVSEYRVASLGITFHCGHAGLK